MKRQTNSIQTLLENREGMLLNSFYGTRITLFQNITKALQIKTNIPYENRHKIQIQYQSNIL